MRKNSLQVDEIKIWKNSSLEFFAAWINSIEISIFNVDSRKYEYVIFSYQKLLILAVKTFREPFSNFDFIDLERSFS